MLSGVIKNEEDWSEIITTLPAGEFRLSA